ncbi:MAG: organomercurial lyase [Gaiellaceae bacterium]
MKEQAIEIPALAEYIVDGFMDKRDPPVALVLYRLLAEGEPVSREHLVERSGLPADRVGAWLGAARVERDERGRVVAFQGLSQRPTWHVQEVDGRTLYAWCTEDALAIHDLLGRPARVRSTDPITGEPVSMSLVDGRVVDVAPPTTVLSMPRPSAPLAVVGDDVVPGACGPINFFGSEESGRAFTERVEGTSLLTLEEGLELARLINRAVFGSALASGLR